MTRWHPDKFEQLFGDKIPDNQKKHVFDRVKGIAQVISLKMLSFTLLSTMNIHLCAYFYIYRASTKNGVFYNLKVERCTMTRTP